MTAKDLRERIEELIECYSTPTAEQSVALFVRYLRSKSATTLKPYIASACIELADELERDE